MNFSLFSTESDNRTIFLIKKVMHFPQTTTVDLAGRISDSVLLTNFGVVEAHDVGEGGERREIQLGQGKRVEE
jgi:hypothetical protein